MGCEVTVPVRKVKRNSEKNKGKLRRVNGKGKERFAFSGLGPSEGAPS